jgi:hypothetical protein
VSVSDVPSKVPTTVYAPQVVPFADSSSSTASQSQFGSGTPPHCGG